MQGFWGVSYFHVQWDVLTMRAGAKAAGGGFVHPIEDEKRFKRDFGLNVVAGACLTGYTADGTSGT